MKKALIALVCVLVAGVAMAEMDAYVIPVTTTNFTANSNSVSLRGLVYAIQATVPAGVTNGAFVVRDDDGVVLFSKTLTASGRYNIRGNLCDTNGTAIARCDFATNTIAEFGGIPVCGPVWLIVTPSNVQSKQYSVKLYYQK